MSKFLLYTLSDPITDELRYIGQTTVSLERRLKGHIWNSTIKRDKTHKSHWVKKIVVSGHKPKIELFEEFDNKKDLDEAEIFWISQFKSLGCRLTNTTEGGEGVLGLRRPHTEEEKRKVSLKLKGVKKSPRTELHTLNNTLAQSCKKIKDQFNNTYISVNSASRQLNICRSLIARVLKGIQKQTHGYIFMEVK